MAVVTVPGTGDAYLAPPLPRCAGCGLLLDHFFPPYCTFECYEVDHPQDLTDDDAMEADDAPL